MAQLRKLVTVMLLFWVPASFSWSQGLDEAWLKKLLEASRHTNYSGHTVVLKDGRLSSFSVVHGIFDGEVWERVVSLSGGRGEVIRKGDEVICLSPSQTTRIASRAQLSKLGTLEQGLDNIAQFYEFNEVSHERVANRDALVLEAKPLDTYRFGYRLWLDKAKGVLLKMETYGADNSALETFEYVSIEFDKPLQKSDFEPSSTSRRKAGAMPEQAQVGSLSPPGWAPSWLPPGFYKVREAGFISAKSGVSSQLFTDGLAAITIFHQPQQDQQFEHVQTLGATVAYDKFMGNALVTVVGEVPQSTAERIAVNVKAVAVGP